MAQGRRRSPPPEEKPTDPEQAEQPEQSELPDVEAEVDTEVESQTEVKVETDGANEADEIIRGLKEAGTWSAKIRYLHSKGFRNSSIAHIITELRGYVISMQHVNNVLTRPLKSPSENRGPGRPRQIVDPRTEKVIRQLPKPILIKTPKNNQRG